MTPPGLGHVLAADPRQAEVEVEERLQDRAHEPVDERVDALVARAGVERVVRAGLRFARSRPWLPGRGPARYSPGHVPDGHANPARRPRRRRRRRGVGGAAAARPPRLRRPLRRHRAARPLGRALRRRLAGRRRRPAPRQRRACSAPSTRTSRRRCRCRPRCAGRSPGSPSTSRPGRAPRCVDRVHPARSDLPQLWGSGRAFAQATWRHVLFGFVLGELERRLNPPEELARPGRRRGRLDERARLRRAPGRARARPPP